MKNFFRFLVLIFILFSFNVYVTASRITETYWNNFSSKKYSTTDLSPNPQKVILSNPPDNALRQPLDINFTWYKPQELLDGFKYLSLKDNIDNISQYQFELVTDTVSLANLILDSMLVDTNKLVNGLSYLTAYYWRVKAKNETGWGEYSDWWKFTTYSSICEAPDPNGPVYWESVDAPTLHWLPVVNPSNCDWVEVTGLPIPEVGAMIQDSSFTIPIDVWRSLIAGQQYTWGLKTIENPVPKTGGILVRLPMPAAPPTLLYPSNDTVGTSLTPVLEWIWPPLTPKCRVQVATDSIFTNVVIEDSSMYQNPPYMVPAGILQPATRYYWHVQRRGWDLWSPYSETRHFTTSGPSKVQLHSPRNDSANAPVDLSFSWFKPSETLAAKKVNPLSLSDNLLTISQYWFEVTTDTVSFANLIKDTTLTDTTKSLSGFNYSTVYYWRVKGKNETGWGTFSDWWKFTTTLTFPQSNWFVQYVFPMGIRSLCFLNTQTGWALGESNSSVFKTTDGGYNWTKISEILYFCRNISFGDASNGIASAGGMPTNYAWFYCFDGGTNWQPMAQTDYYGSSMKWVTHRGGTWWMCGSVTTFWPFNYYEVILQSGGVNIVGLSSAFTLNRTKAGVSAVYTVGSNGNVFRDLTSMGVPDNTANLNDASFGDANTGYVTGGAFLYKTTNNCSSWTRLYPRSGGSYGDLGFVNKDTGWLSCTFSGTDRILKTTNGGVTWDEDYTTGAGQFSIFNGPGYPIGWSLSGSNLLKTVTPVPPSPYLVSPLNNSTGISLTPTLEWTYLTDAIKYRVQVSTDSNFITTVLDDSSSVTSQFIVPASILNYNTIYYWRASARNSNAWGSFSDKWNFRTYGSVPQTTLLSPANNSIPKYENITFSWYKAIESLTAPLKGGDKIILSSSSLKPEALNGPDVINKYWFELTTDTTTLERLVRDTTISDTTKTLNDLSFLTSYWWRVKAKNEFGWGPFSGWWKFTTCVNYVWNQQTSGISNYILRSVYFVNALTGWVCGWGGTILNTTNGGINWNQQTSGTAQTLHDINFINSNSGWAVGDGANILKTTNGGINWFNLQPPSPVSLFKSVFFKDSATGFVISNYSGYTYIDKTTDGGNNWNRVFSWINTLNKISYPKSAPALTGFVCGRYIGNGALLKTTDEGVNWNLITGGTGNQTLNGISFVNTTTGWTVGNLGTILFTTDGGNSFINQNSIISADFQSVSFANENTGWAVGSGGTIVSTSNGGTNWYPNISNTETFLNSVCILAPNIGYAVGWDGVILKLSSVLQAPALISPENNSTGISITPLLDWNDAFEAVKYRLQVSAAPAFSTTILDDSTITTSQYNIAGGVLNPGTKYYWRAASSNDTIWSAFSEPWSFTTLNNPSRVQLSSPRNDSANAPVDLNFSWFKPSETLLAKKVNPLSLSDNLLSISQYWFELTTDTVSMLGLITDTTLTDTTKFVSGLSYSTVYYWRVKGKNETGWGTFSNWWKFTTTNGLPLAPVLLLPVNRKTDVTIYPLLDWNDVSGALKYKLQVSPYADFHVLYILDSNITGSQYQVTGGLAYNSGYYWRVNAKSVVDWGPFSTKFVFYTQYIPPPLAPVLVSPVNNSTGNSLIPLLDWNNVSGAVKYKVQISPDTLFSTLIVNDSTPVNSDFTVPSGLLNGNSVYYWRVAAKNSMYWGDYSARWSFTTINAPAKVVLNSPKDDSLNAPADMLFTWFKPAETLMLSKTVNNLISKESPLSILSYDLEITTDTISLTGLIRDTTIADTSKFVNGLSYSADYFWRVRAKNEVGWGQYSDWRHFTTEQEIPSAPVLIFPPNNSTGISLTPLFDWSDVVNSVRYKLTVSLDVNFTTVLFNDTNITASEFQLPAGLSAGTKYYWRAAARNSNAWGPYSEVWNFTTLNVPQKVVQFSPPDDTTNMPANVIFQWYKAIDGTANPFALKNIITKKTGLAVTNYWFELAIDTSGFARIVVDSTLTDTSKNVTGLNYTDEYFWRVKAKNEAGWGQFSGWWNFTTGEEIVNPPALISPADSTSGITLAPVMDWGDVSGALLYKIQIAADSLFTGIILFDSTAQSQYNISAGTLSSCTKYYWRAAVQKAAGWSAYSGAWSFTTICAPQQIILANPPNNAVNQPINITFRWYSPSEGAAASLRTFRKNEKGNSLRSVSNYWFELTSDTNTLAGLISDSTQIDTSRLVAGFSYLTTYYWRVKAKNEAGWGQFGSWWKFTTQSNLPGVPVLLSPPNQASNISIYPLLDWANVIGAIGYKVQVSPYADFHLLVVYDTTLISSEYQVPGGLAYNSGYFWRAAAKNDETWGNYSGAFRFFTSLFPPPNPPALLAPANNAINISLTPLLDWADASGASLYRIQLSTDSEFTSNLIFDSTASSEFQIPAGLLQNLTAYYWRVGAKNTSGWGSYTSAWKFTTTPGASLPPAPTLLSPVNNQMNISINPLLDWNDIGGAMNFRLQLSVFADFHTLIINDSSLTSSQYRVNGGLAYNSGYFWRVQALNVNGWGSYSSVFRFFTSFTPPPPAPTLISPANNSVDVALGPVLDWSDVLDAMNLKSVSTGKTMNAEDVTTYRLQISEEPTFTTGLIYEDTNITGSTYNMPEGYLMWTTKYYWRVAGKNASGWGSYSTAWNFTTLTDELPQAPVLITPVNRASEVNLIPLLDWNDVITASRYRVQVSTNRFFTTFAVNDSNVSASQFQVTGGLAYNSGYYWRVQAKNAIGWSEYSTVFVFYTQITPPPPPPALVSPSNNSIGISLTPLLDWDNVSGATKYCVQVSNLINFSNLIVNDTTTGVSQFTVPAGRLNNNTVYYWRVSLKNASTWGTFSSPWNFKTTLGVIEPPILITPHNNDTGLTNTPLLDWSDVGGAVQYRVQVSAYSSFSVLWIDTYVPASQLQVTGGLAYNSGYFWRVKSFSGTDSSAYSTVWRFFTLRYPPLSALSKQELTKTLDISEFAGTKKKADAIEICSDTSFSDVKLVIQDINSDKVMFSTSGLDNFTSYFWRVKKNSNKDAPSYSNVRVFVTGFINDNPIPVIPVKENKIIPEAFELHQNYPNPFNTETMIRFDLPKDGNVKMSLYDITGKEIRIIADGYYPAGYYSVRLNAEDLSSGVYFYKITYSEFTSIKKLVLIK